MLPDIFGPLKSKVYLDVIHCYDDLPNVTHRRTVYTQRLLIDIYL